MVAVHLTKGTTKPFLPSFSKSTQREHILLFYIWKRFSGSNFYNTFVTAPFIQTLELDKRSCIQLLLFKFLNSEFDIFTLLSTYFYFLVTVPRYFQMKVAVDAIIQRKEGDYRISHWNSERFLVKMWVISHPHSAWRNYDDTATQPWRIPITL